MTTTAECAEAILRAYPEGYSDIDPRRLSEEEIHLLLPVVVAALHALEAGLDPRRIIQAAAAVTDHSRKARRVA